MDKLGDVRPRLKMLIILRRSTLLVLALLLPVYAVSLTERLEVPPEWREMSPGVYALQGRAPLEVLGELYEVEIGEGDVDTVGGLVFARHGTVPESGTVVVDEAHGLRFTVEEMDERRIVSVTVEKTPEEPRPDDQAG